MALLEVIRVGNFNSASECRSYQSTLFDDVVEGVAERVDCRHDRDQKGKKVHS
jgi:hypothetical protein